MSWVLFLNSGALFWWSRPSFQWRSCCSYLYRVLFGERQPGPHVISAASCLHSPWRVVCDLHMALSETHVFGTHTVRFSLNPTSVASFEMDVVRGTQSVSVIKQWRRRLCLTRLVSFRLMGICFIQERRLAGVDIWGVIASVRPTSKVFVWLDHHNWSFDNHWSRPTPPRQALCSHLDAPFHSPTLDMAFAPPRKDAMTGHNDDLSFTHTSLVLPSLPKPLMETTIGVWDVSN